MLAAGEHMAKTLSPEGSPIGRSYYLGDASSPKVQVTELLDCVWITAYPETTPKMEFCPDWRRSDPNLTIGLDERIGCSRESKPRWSA
jgi:hypothetical protein